MSDVELSDDEQNQLFNLNKAFEKDLINANNKLNSNENEFLNDISDEESFLNGNENVDYYDMDSEEDDDPSASNNFNSEDYSDQIDKDDRLDMIYLRSFLNRVEKIFQEKDLASQKINQELKKCQKNIEELEAKRDQVFRNIQDKQNSENLTIVKRLDKEHASLCQQIELESKVLEKLNQDFEAADYERSKALLEKTKYTSVNIKLRKKEELLIQQKDLILLTKKQVEDKKVEMVKEKLEKTKQIENEKIRIQNQKQKEAIEQAKLTRMITAKYLQQNLREMKEKKQNEEKEMMQNAESKRKELINLKHTIDHNKEMFQAKVNKNKYNELLKKQALKEEMQQILNRGENPNFFMPRKVKMEEFEKMKKKFEQEKLNNTQDIVRKILKENDNLEKKKQLYPNLFNLKPLNPINKTKDVSKNELKKMAKLAKSLGLSSEQMNELKLVDDTEKLEEDNFEQRSQFGGTSTVASKDGDDDSDLDELNHMEEVLVKPEFEGLWNKKVEKYDANDLYKAQEKFPNCFKTKAEIELFLKSLDKLKKSAVREQVVAGRKFVGTSFKSQPKVIHFKDFDVGNKYNIKVTLTNISYTINTCKLIDITEKLKDFITIDFQPPGQLSAGLTFDFSVTFEPKINKDLEGEIQFLSTNGPFSIPILCTIKKCDLSLSNQSINFGTIVIGENLNKKIQLMNKGALGTKFKMITSQEFRKKNSSTIDDSLIDKSKLELNETIEQEKYDEIKIGKISEGFLGPFSTIELDFIFSPSFPGKFNQDFVIEFEDEDSKELHISTKATAIDVPIWIENVNIDLRICMYDRLYQEVIRVHNRASAALRITFDVPNEMKNHLEILPKTAFIQAKSDFSAQIKFIAKNSLAVDAPNYFDKLTGVLELPLHIKVADQTNTVDYNLHAIVTTSDLEFDVTEIDFGYCTIYETAKATVHLTNKSILCQPFGFVKLNEFVNVQPNDGFGTLLPNETIPIDINFSPKSAKEYKFTVLCKSLVNRDFVINCRGIGVHPPLKLSAQRINFKATCLKSTSTKTIFICNNHLDYDQHRHPVPRIGNGEIAKVGPTHFEFDLPEDCPFTLSPNVGVVNPGQKLKVTLQYTADVDETDVKKDTAKYIKAKMVEKASKLAAIADSNQSNNETSDTTETKGKKKTVAQPKQNKSELTLLSQQTEPPKTPDIETIDTNSSDYFACLTDTLNNYKGGLKHFQIPCYIASPSDENDPTKPIEYSIHNTLYLDVVCPSVKPEIIVISKDSNKVINFGKASIGQKTIKKIPIKNISDSTIKLKSNLLDTNGAFLILSTFDYIEPGNVENLVVAFIPNKSCIFQENLVIKTDKSNLTFVLNAVGVEPSFSLSFEGNTFDFGYCLANEKSEKNIEMKNNSKVPIEFSVTLDSSNKHQRKENELARFRNFDDSKFKPPIGPNNHSGFSSFDVYPIQGVIQAGGKLDLKIIFSPDHNSELYADTMRISLLSSSANSKTIQLFGKSRKKAMYVRGVEFLTSNLNNESMILTDFETENSNEGQEIASKDSLTNKVDMPIPIPILVTLNSVTSSKNIGEFTQAEKIIYIGCMRSSPSGDKKEAKKNGEFGFDNIKEINSKGFNIDLAKSAVEPGGERQVKITWKPQPGTDIKQTTQASILLTTKSNSIETWKLYLQGRIVSETNYNQAT